MYMQAGAQFEAVLDDSTPGLVGDLELGILDNIGGTTQAFDTAAITEIAQGLYSAVRTSPDDAGQYSLVWKLASDPMVVRGVEDLFVLTTVGEPFSGQTYASLNELFRILKIRTPTAEQAAAAVRVLATATGEINAEVDRADDDPLSGWEVDVATTVCLDRAADLWRHTESIPGVMAVLDDTSPMPSATGYWRYSWERYAQRLAPLKRQWGLA